MVFAGFDNTYPEMYGISIDILISSPVALLNYRQKRPVFSPEGFRLNRYFP